MLSKGVYLEVVSDELTGAGALGVTAVRHRVFHVSHLLETARSWSVTQFSKQSLGAIQCGCHGHMQTQRQRVCHKLFLASNQRIPTLCNEISQLPVI